MEKIAKQVTVFNVDTGKIINETISYGSQNGDDWMIVYRNAFEDFLLTAPDLTTAKVFGVLMTQQKFEGGINTTKKAVADKIKISYRSVMTAFNWLKEHGYIKERKINGQTEFLLNPDVTTCGKNKKSKVNLWNSIEPKSIRI